MAKKLTMKQVKAAIDNLIVDVVQLKSAIAHIDGLLGGYIRFNKDKDKFEKWVDEQVKEYQEKKEEYDASRKADGDSDTGTKESK